MQPTVRDIVESHLRANGFDGLANSEIECGCIVGDLMPCGSPDPCECIVGRNTGTDDEFWIEPVKDSRQVRIDGAL